jgi:ADP-ribosylglycohydrolase
MEGTIYPGSKSNGALMRCHPIGILGVNVSEEECVKWAIEDANLTHDNDTVREYNIFHCLLIRALVRGDLRTNGEIIGYIETLMVNNNFSEETVNSVRDSYTTEPLDLTVNAGLVSLASSCAIYHLLNTDNILKAYRQTIVSGGDTDTNAAIVGALWGARYGVPENLKSRIRIARNCEPKRKKEYWPRRIDDFYIKLNDIISNG